MKRWVVAALAVIVLVGLATRCAQRKSNSVPASEQSAAGNDVVLESAGVPGDEARPPAERETAVISEPSARPKEVRPSPETERRPVGVVLGMALPPVSLADLEARGELWRLVQTKVRWEIDESLATPEQQAIWFSSREERVERDGSFRLDPVLAEVPLRIEVENPFGPSCSLALEPLLEGEVRRVEIELPAGAVITGIVLDQDGLPVRDALLRVSPPPETVRHNDEDILHEPQTYSGEDGRFRIDKVKRAKRQLSIRGPFRSMGDIEVDTTHEDILDLVLRVDRGVELELIVLWPDGTPVESFEMELSWAYPTTQHGKNGRHTVKGLEPGTALGIKIDATGAASGAGSAVRSVLLPSPPIEIVLGGEGTSDVTIRLIDREGESCDGTVSMYGPLDGLPAYLLATELDSTYVFQDLPAGEWLLSASPFGSQRIDSRISLDGQPLELTLDVPPTARVSGTVRDASGRPVEGAVVGDETGVFTARFFERKQDRTDRAGRFSIIPDTLTSRIVAVASGHGASAPLELQLAPGEHLRDVELQLLPACQFDVVVLEVDGAPVVGAWVEVVSAGRIPSHRQTDANGSARFEDLAPGLLFVAARHPDHASNRQCSTSKVELRPDLERKLELRFRRSDPVHVQGRLVTQEHTAGASLHLLTPGFDAQLEVDAEGRFEGNLPSAGRWRGRLLLAGESVDLPVRCVELLVAEGLEREALSPVESRLMTDPQEYLRWIAGE